MGAVPVLASVSEREAGVPTAIDPKLRLAGVICRWDWMPTPVSGTVSGALTEELAMVRVPASVPDCMGVKLISRAQLVPGASVAVGVGQVPVPIE